MIQLEWEEQIPAWVIAYHRLARRGSADNVTTSGLTTLARFNMEGRVVDKFAPLANSITVWLHYRSQ